MKKILVIIALVIFSINQVYALDSSGVIYDNSGSGSTATNVNDALNDLYSKLNQKQEEINNINNIGNAGANHILKGYTAYVKGKTVTGTIPSKGAATYTPNTKDQTIASGNYLSGIQTIKGDANLIAGNIVTGKSIFGVTGTYTSDANAVAGNILSGKTAYVNGSKITGTIPSKGAATYTPNTKDQTIASGNYLSGIQTIKGDANLIAANIAKGKSIFGIAGSYTSDANAVAGNILSGKTAYVNGSKIAGSMKNWSGTPQHIDAVRLANDRFEVAVAAGYHGYYWAGNSYEYLEYSQVANTIGLTAAKLAKGQTVLGIAGTYTSDANAIAGNILSGKTAYVNGSKIIGTMPTLETAAYNNGSTRQANATGITSGALSDNDTTKYLYLGIPKNTYTGNNLWIRTPMADVIKQLPNKAATTYTPGTTNQTIASGNYLSGTQTIKGDANLIAANIAKGKTIFGVTGTYTSDANAVAANILKDKTAYVNGSKITGTIASKAAATYTPGTSNQTIASGNYLSGAQTIKGDANLVASNIAKGKTIFGVSGTYTSDATATAADIKSGKTAYVNGSKITGTASGGDAKVYTFSKKTASIPSGVTLKNGSWVALATKGNTEYYSIDLGFTPSEVVACELQMTGNYSSDSASSSNENFRYVRMNNWIYMPDLIGVSKYNHETYNAATVSNWNGFYTKCSVSGRTLRFEVHNIYDGGDGWSIYTRADTLYLSGTLVYK